MLVLITNDDGYQAEGIQTLAAKFSKKHDVWMVAPHEEQSACSHKLTLHDPLRIKEIAKQSFSVNGTPTDCVYLAVHHLLPKKPDIIISGINRGPNLGDDVTYSGTVAAAMEAAILDIPSIAISMAGFENLDYEVGANVALMLAEKIEASEIKANVLLNVNIPGDMTTSDKIRTRFVKLGKRKYDQFVVERIDPRKRKYYWIGGKPMGSKAIADSDIEAIEQGFVTITPLMLDLTDYNALSDMKTEEE